MATIISVANQKGGEGKTTTALNLAHGLSLKNMNTLLIDIDPQANSTGIFYDSNDLQNTIYDLFQKKKNPLIKKIILDTKYQNLSILPSSIKLAEIELNSANVDFPYILRDTLQDIIEEFNYIIIDCPPSLSIFTINALVASNYVLVPLQAEKFSIDGIRGLQNTIESIQKRINTELKILGALVTQVKSNTILGKTITPIIQNYFPVFKTTISAGVVVGESHISKELLQSYKHNAKQSIEYKNLTEEVYNGTQK